MWAHHIQRWSKVAALQQSWPFVYVRAVYIDEVAVRG